MQIKSLLLTTDFSAAARSAYPTAARLARRLDAPLHLVHVAESLPPHFFLHGMGIETDIPKEPYLDAVDKRLRQEESKHAAFSGIDVRPKLLYHSSPAEAVARFLGEEGIDLAVLSTHGHSALGYFFLGSFAQQLIRHAPRPVLTVRAPEDEAAGDFEPADVLVPFDFSENSKAVFPVVRMLARTFGSRFRFLYTVELAPTYVDFNLEGIYAGQLSSVMEEARDQAPKTFEELRPKELAGVDVTFESTTGIPAQVILERARETGPDLIVMSTHGWTGFRHLILGSVAERIVQGAPCSILTVRPPRTDGE